MGVQLHLRCSTKNVNRTFSPPVSDLNSSLSFPEPVPLGTRVPNWAFNNPIIVSSDHPFLSPAFSSPLGYSLVPGMNHWRSLLAVRIFANEPHLLCILGTGTDLPEVTGSASIVPSSTSHGGTQSTNPPKTSSSVASSGSSDTAAIAGGVVGGFVGIALVVGFLAWFTVRRGRARAASPMEHSGDLRSDMAAVPYTQATKRPGLYVSLFCLPAAAKAYTSVADLFIALYRTLRTRAHIQRMHLPQRSKQRTQEISTLALRPTYNQTERYTAAYRRSEGPNLASVSFTDSPIVIFMAIGHSQWAMPLCTTNKMNETRSQPLYIRS